MKYHLPDDTCSLHLFCIPALQNEEKEWFNKLIIGEINP